ncbi:hypothetical protein [uncultured Methylobacterium sp.]|jgi:hypothetical protein|uniref:hypothetical protein n=1 Tax=uncultured Methylobacterium sp. TaxID=157278 RepID=UPI002623BADB|nr:hypothetical protein [uncultured Methylobacterium sp.]
MSGRPRSSARLGRAGRRQARACALPPRAHPSEPSPELVAAATGVVLLLLAAACLLP